MNAAITDTLMVTWRNLKRIPRIPELAIFAILQSIMFVLLFAFVFGGAIIVPGYESNPNAYREFLMPGIFAQNIVFAAGIAGAVAPWIARNAVVLGRPALTYGYDSHTFAQRVAFNQMTWREYGLFFVCGLPDGTGAAKQLFGQGACQRFSWDPEEKQSYYYIGNNAFMSQTLAEAGGWQQHLSHLVRDYVLASPIKHLLVTVPFALAGSWVNNYWGLFLSVACVALTVQALRERNDGILLVTLPAWFMLLFHAGVAIATSGRTTSHFLM